MGDVFHILLGISLAAVTVTLCLGIYALFRGGDFGRSWSNKLMRLRVVLQFAAIVILAASYFWLRRGH
jgi:hypothetical protein